MSNGPVTTDPQSARLAIIITARGMLAGEIDLLEGCRTILRYRRELGDRMGTAFLTLEGVESETDDFPEGSTRDSWDPDALQRKDREKEEYLRRARGPLLEACKAIISTLSD